MTTPIQSTGAGGQAPQPQPLNPQQQKLVELGIPKDIVLQGDEAIKKFAEMNNITLPPKEAPSQTPIPIGQPSQSSAQPETGVEHSDAPPATEEQLQAKRRHQSVSQDFINKQKAYANAVQDYEALEKEVQQMQQEYNAAFEKKVSLTKKQKEEKAAARDLAAKNLEEAQKGLAAARDRMLKAKEALGGDEGVAQANKYTREHAETQYEREAAAKTEVEDRLHSDTGRAAIEREALELARGGADHKLTRSERRARQEEVRQQLSGDSPQGLVSEKFARKAQRIAEKNYQLMLKEDALKEIYIGNKDAYKAAAKGQDKDKPEVTFMSKDTYEAARKIAASKGLLLPENATKLDKEQSKALQKIMMDAVGDMGSRGDLNESRGVAKQFNGVSAHEVRKIMDATNLDPQKDYTGAAIAAGALATAATAIATGGVTDVVGAVDAISTPLKVWVPGTGGPGGTGHYETINVITDAVDGHKTLNWGKAGLSLAAGVATEELVRRIANHDPNIFKKGKAPRDVIYQELGGIDAFKKTKKNQRKVMAQVLADEKLKPEQKLAYLEAAMGDGGPKLNNRELIGLYVAMRAHEDGKDAPTVEDVRQSTQDVYIMKEGHLVDKNNKPVDTSKLVDDYGRPYNIKGTGAQGAAVDPKIAARTGKPTIATNVDFEHNPNKPGDLTQIIISDEDGEVSDVTGDNVEEPDSFTLNDNSNGPDHRNSYNFRKLSADEITQNKLDPAKGPFYVLVSAKGPKAEDIGQSIGKVFSYTFAKHSQKEEAHIMENDEIVEDVTIEKITPQYLLDAATMIGSSSPVYIKTGALKGTAQRSQPARAAQTRQPLNGVRNDDPTDKPAAPKKTQPKADPKTNKRWFPTRDGAQPQEGRWFPGMGSNKISINVQPGASDYAGKVNAQLDNKVRNRLTNEQKAKYDKLPTFDAKVAYLRDLGYNIELIQ